MRPNLYYFHTRSPTTTSAAPGSANPSNSSALSLTEPLASSGNPQSIQYCHSWNDRRCRWPSGRCGFCHSCETCHGDHPRILLSTLARMAPLPFSVKGGHRCPRPPLLTNSVAHRFDSVLGCAPGNFSALELRYPFVDLLSSRV